MATQYSAANDARVSNDLPREPQSPNVSNQNASSYAANGDTPAALEGDSAQSTTRLDSVLHSDIGVSTLLNRLKQSISSAHDFEIFLKKRAALEEEHAQGLKKLSRGTYELIRRPENRQGSFAHNYEEVTRIHDRMADHGLQYAMSLRQMSEDLSELQANMERQRKHWKQDGLTAEKRMQDTETALDKAKSKYDSLAEQWDRARTGDRQSSRFGIKGPKSGAQQEEELYRKAQNADADYAAKVQAAQTHRQELNSKLRPQAVSALRDLITECDSGLTMQLQKFAAFNEQLLLRNGLCISPLKNQAAGDNNQRRSLREVAQNIDNDRDFHDYVMSFSNKAGPRPPDITYQKHPAFSQQRQVSSPQYPQNSMSSQNGPPGGFPEPSRRTTSGNFDQGYRQGYPPQQQQQQQQISGVTPPQQQSYRNEPPMGQGSQYQNGTSPYNQNQSPGSYPRNQGPGPSPPSQGPSPYSQNQGPNQYSQNQGPSPYAQSQGPTPYPSNQGPHQASVDPRVNNHGPSPLPQLPPVGGMSGALPSRDADRQPSGPMNNNYRNDGRPDGSSIVSPLTPSPGPESISRPMSNGQGRPVGPDGRLQDALGMPANGLINTSHAGAPMPGQYNSYRGEPPSAGPRSAGAQNMGPYDRSGRGTNDTYNDKAPSSTRGNTFNQNVPSNNPNSNFNQNVPSSNPNSNYNQNVASNQTNNYNQNMPPSSPQGQVQPPRGESSRQGNHSHSSSIVPGIFKSADKPKPESQRPHLPPLKPVFGVSLDELFRRDNSAVPMIVYQCVQAVDLFGLDVEGLYRTSGSAPYTQHLKSLSDNDSSQVDFRNPAAYNHDIASVTTLLKNFFRDLPDPLLTSANYTSFIDAAKVDDDIGRRDSLHAIINSLPDPNYATLRVLTLHLHRVVEHQDRNKMNAANIAICLGPTLMGQQGPGGGAGVGGDIRDAGFQARVVETILANTFQIFDDDD